MTINNEHTKIIKNIFFTVIVLLSATTTFLFFYQNVNIAPDWPQWVSGWISGVMGVTVLDIGAIAWLRIYLTGCENNKERSLSLWGFAIDLIGSAITTGIQLLISTQLINLPPDITTYSMLAIAFVVVANFVLATMHTRNSTQSQIDEKQSAMVAQGIQDALDMTEQMFKDGLPELAKRKAEQMLADAERAFLNSTGGGIALPPTPERPQITAATGGKMDVGIVANSGKPEYTPDTAIDPNFT